MIDKDGKIRVPLEGVVVDSNDPQGRWRVKVKVPGVYEPESDWMLPWGTIGGGSKGRGGFIPPAKDATVGVFCVNGDPENPRYICGYWPEGGLPPDSNNGDPDTFAFAVGGLRFVFSKGKVDDDFPDGRGYGRIYTTPGNSGQYIEIDGEQNSIAIIGLTNIFVQAVGRVKVDGVTVEIKKRVVLPAKKGI